jgi:NADH dehydrogenase
LIGSGLSYAILRPTVIFGSEDILINNIAYFLRRLPIFAVPGDGKYQIQPIYVEDMASLAVSLGENRSNIILDAVGPEIYTFNHLLDLLARAVGSRSVIVHLPAMLALWLSQILGLITRDVVLTREEVRGLEQNLLVSDGPPSGTTSFKAWVWENRDQLGSQYASELARHYRYGHKSAAV